MAAELESDLRDTVDWGSKWLVDFNAGKTQLVSFDQSNNTGAIDVKLEGSVLEEKSTFKMLVLSFSKLDWGYYIISIGKTASKKGEALICSVKFLFPDISLYLYKSTMWPCMEFCCHVWAGAPSCYFEMLDNLQKRICTTVCPSLAVSLDPAAHYRNIVNLSLFYRCYSRLSSELAQLVLLPHSRWRSRYYNRMHDKGAYVNSFFPCIARLWNSLSIEYFRLTYDGLNDLSRINRRHLSLGSFKTDSLYALIFLYFFSCNCMPLNGCSALHGVIPN